MREILYKAKRIDNGEWVEGYYFCMNHNDERKHVHHFIIPIGTDLSKGRPIDEIQVEVDHQTICQYTGLTDKHFNKIFENDRVVAIDSSRTTGTVKFRLYSGIHHGFHIVWDGTCAYRQDICYWADLVELIGNIYDNQ